MANDTIAQIHNLDPALLIDIVRQDQRSPTFAIVDWQAERLTDKGIINPDGLFRVYGQGRDDGETRPWSVVLKVLYQPSHAPEPANLWYWKREVEAVQSGLFATLPNAIGAPRFYGVTVQQFGVTELPDGGCAGPGSSLKVHFELRFVSQNDTC